MKIIKNAISIFFLLFGFCGCEKMFLEPDPQNTPEQNFEIFWNDFDRYYAQFSIRNIDWDSVYTLYLPQISSSTTEQQLFGIISNIVRGINDMHIDLYTPFGDVSWKSLAPASYPSMRLINACKYVQCGSPQNSIIGYRTCKNSSIGYMIIPTFSGGTDGLSFTDERYLVIDEILSNWKNMKGIIIDLRWNHGGNTNNAETVAGRFVDKSRVYTQYREKIGPGKQDFSQWKNSTIEPRGTYQFLKQVVVLTSRATASSAEMFVMAMHTLPNVTVVGDTTGGGVGAPVYRELPNGWTYRLSTRYYADAQQRIMEGVGIFPDVSVITTVADSSNGIDKILEKGIEIITNSK
jgi:hypothetical protein